MSTALLFDLRNKSTCRKFEQEPIILTEDFTIIPWGQTNHRFNALSSQMSQRRHQMPTKQSNKKSIRNGIIYDIVTSVGSTVTALLYEPTKETAQKAEDSSIKDNRK